jgi:hypothetical protein
MKNLLFIFLVLGLFLACEQAAAPEATDDAAYAIADDSYVDLAKDAMGKLSAMDFDAWGAMLADDVVWYFPDGDSKTRTALEGRDAVVGWWKNWNETSGATSLTFADANYIPVKANETQATTGLAGVYVLSWMNTAIAFENGNTARFRMNSAVHFNADNKIDRYFNYYDRTGIIQAAGGNILAPAEEEAAAEE